MIGVLDFLKMLTQLVERELIGVCKADLMQLHERLQQYTRQLRHCPTNIHDYHTIIIRAVNELYKPSAVCEPTTAAVADAFESLPMETGVVPAIPMAYENSNDYHINPPPVKREHLVWQDDSCDSPEVLPASGTASEAGGVDYSQSHSDIFERLVPLEAAASSKVVALMPSPMTTTTTAASTSSAVLSVGPASPARPPDPHDTDPIATLLLKKVRPVQGRFQCPITGCHHTSPYKDNLRKHVRRVHTRSATVYKCPLCVFESSMAPCVIRKHIQTKHKHHEICQRLDMMQNEELLKSRQPSGYS